MKRIILILLASLLALPSFAQKYPERRLVREGNKQYDKGDYPSAEVAYRRAMEKTPWSYEAADNYAKSLYKQERYDEASKVFTPLAADSAHTQYAAAAYYDNGNAQFKQRKLQEALESYKQSLRINPGDMEAKFNLAYTQKLLENEKNGGGGGNDKNQDNQNQNQDKQDQQGDDKQDNGQQPQQDKPQPSDAQQGQGNMSRQEADQMLDAVQMSEDKTRDKMDEKKAAVARPPSGKNW